MSEPVEVAAPRRRRGQGIVVYGRDGLPRSVGRPTADVPGRRLPAVVAVSTPAMAGAWKARVLDRDGKTAYESDESESFGSIAEAVARGRRVLRGLTR